LWGQLLSGVLNRNLRFGRVDEVDEGSRIAEAGTGDYFLCASGDAGSGGEGFDVVLKAQRCFGCCKRRKLCVRPGDVGGGFGDDRLLSCGIRRGGGWQVGCGRDQVRASRFEDLDLLG
jgi:hypothetical protein